MSKPKQEQRFEKVVEWKEKPKIGSIIFFSILYIIILILDCLLITEKIFNIIDYFSTIFISIVYFFVIIKYFIGKGREVYWRKIE